MSEDSKIKIVIADDHLLVREGIRTLLGRENGMIIVGEAPGGNELLKLLETTDCDLLLLDLNMPGMSGLDVIKTVRQKYPKILILVLSMFPLTRFAVRSLKAGAVGYVTKDSTSEELLKAINTVAHRGKYISLELAEMLAEEFGSQKKAL
ncbi:MAG: response regulator transcription factor, partial [Syntrophothermus sp.]